MRVRTQGMVDELFTEEREMLAKTLYGLEDILANELKELGAKEITPGRRMVAFKGDKKLLYKANIHLRTALRVLVPIAQFEATNADEIYQYLYDHVEWKYYLTTRNTFAVDTVVYSDQFTHSKFVAYRAKDAIADYFNDHDDRRPNVSVVDPDVLFHIHIADTTVTIALDSSGESLHKRGYRVGQNDAPLSEVLAAGILLKAGWSGQCNLLDPMCGSGTFLTEAALIALGIPPGIFRQEYAFERWIDFDSDLLSEILEDWEEKPFHYKLYGTDIHPKAIAITRGNIKNAGIGKYVQLEVQRFEDYTTDNRPSDDGIIVMNPPYGERMKPSDLENLYAAIGTTLKHSFAGWKAWIISGNVEEGFNAIGLKHFSREKLYNGTIECELRGYEMFEGKRNDHLEELSQKGLLPTPEERQRYYAEREALKREREAFRMGNNNRRSRYNNREDRDRYNNRQKFSDNRGSKGKRPLNGEERRRQLAENSSGSIRHQRSNRASLDNAKDEQINTSTGRTRRTRVFVPRDNNERTPDRETPQSSED